MARCGAHNYYFLIVSTRRQWRHVRVLLKLMSDSDYSEDNDPLTKLKKEEKTITIAHEAASFEWTLAVKQADMDGNVDDEDVDWEAHFKQLITRGCGPLDPCTLNGNYDNLDSVS